MSGFSRALAERLLEEVFADWIGDLHLSVERIGADDAVLRLPFAPKLCRDNGVVCGQALMALADTAMVFAISAAGGGYRPMTTVDQTSHFLRPLAGGDALAEASVVRLGRTMAFGRVTITDEEGRPCALAQTAYAMLAG